MKRRTGLLVAAAAVIVAALAGGLVWATHSESAATDVAPIQGNFSLAQAQGFTHFPLYDAGNSVNGYPLTAVEHDSNPAETISFMYGDCTPPQGSDGSYDGGCPLPVEVQVWPACFRNPASYTQDMTSPIGDKTTIRGVPAAYYEGGNRLEIQTGISTVVIFAKDPASIASELRGVNNDVSASAALPAPAAGAMTGSLTC